MNKKLRSNFIQKIFFFILIGAFSSFYLAADPCVTATTLTIPRSIVNNFIRVLKTDTSHQPTKRNSTGMIIDKFNIGFPEKSSANNQFYALVEKWNSRQAYQIINEVNNLII